MQDRTKVAIDHFNWYWNQRLWMTLNYALCFKIQTLNCCSIEHFIQRLAVCNSCIISLCLPQIVFCSLSVYCKLWWKRYNSCMYVFCLVAIWSCYSSFWWRKACWFVQNASTTWTEWYVCWLISVPSVIECFTFLTVRNDLNLQCVPKT